MRTGQGLDRVTPKPRRWPASARVAASAAALRSVVEIPPDDEHGSRPASRRGRVDEIGAGMAARSASKGSSATPSTPVAASRRTLAAASPSRKSGVSGWKKLRGCGSKVRTRLGCPAPAAIE